MNKFLLILLAPKQNKWYIFSLKTISKLIYDKSQFAKNKEKQNSKNEYTNANLIQCFFLLMHEKSRK